MVRSVWSLRVAKSTATARGGTAYPATKTISVVIAPCTTSGMSSPNIEATQTRTVVMAAAVTVENVTGPTDRFILSPKNIDKTVPGARLIKEYHTVLESGTEKLYEFRVVE